MRIRKTVSKLLGSAMACSSQHLSPPADFWAPVSTDASGLDVCELNQSPWDVYPNLHLFNDEFQDLEPSIISKKEEAEVETKDEEQKDISGNTGGISENIGGISENSDTPIRACQKPTIKSPKKKKEKRKKKDPIVLCKKNDGKKWFCKRPAQLPHSLCEYHLSQSRSYYNINKEKEASQFSVECELATKQKHKSREHSGSGPSPYYYYNGFGPTTRKRRSGMSDDGGSHDDANAMHAADNERILDVCDTSYIGVDEEYDEEIAGELVSDPNDEEKRVPRKRGRKPVKCRSLKSLL